MNMDNINAMHEILHKVIYAEKISNFSVLKDELKDLSSEELTIISIVSNKPDVVLREISSLYHIPPSTLTSILDRIESKGYIKRIISKRDRRSYGLEITEKGRRADIEHREQEKEFILMILSCLESDKERNEFIRMLNTIIGKVFLGIDFDTMLRYVTKL